MLKAWTFLLFLINPIWLLGAEGIHPEYRNNSQKLCNRILTNVASVKELPLFPSKEGRPGEVVPGHKIVIETRQDSNLVVEISRVGGATLPGSLTRDGNRLTLVHEGAIEGKAKRMNPNQAEEKNEGALQELDQHNRTVAQFAIKSEAAGSRKPGEEGQSKYTQEVLDALAETAVKNWDATQIHVREKGADGEPGKVLGSGRIFSSGIDRRVSAYPEFIKEFLRTNKRKWRTGLVDPELTRPLVLEDVLKTRVERPILDIPEGLTLPNGKTIYFLVGEAKEIGAFAIPDDLPDRSVYRSILQNIFRAAFESELPNDYKLHGQLFYGGANEDLINYWEKMGWERANRGKPILMAGDAPGTSESYWVVRRDPESFKTWLDQLGKKSGFDKKQEQNLRKLLVGLSDPGLTDTQRNIWHKFYVDRKTQEDIASELGVSRTTINITLTNANNKIEIQMGVRPPPSPIRLEDIIASANTPGKRRAFDTAVARARKHLTTRQQEVLDLKLKGLKNHEMTEPLGINAGNVGVVLGVVQRRIESELGDAFPVSLRPLEFLYGKLLSAIRTAIPGESEEISQLRRVLYNTELEPGDLKMVDYLRQGLSINEIADARGVDYVAAGSVLRRIREKVDAARLTDKKPSIWRRVLEPEERNMRDEALTRVLGKATARQRKIWEAHEKEVSGMQLARELDVSDGPITKTIRRIKAKVEEELGEKVDSTKFSITHILEAADTPELKKRLKAAVSEAETDLTPPTKGLLGSLLQERVEHLYS